MNKTLKLALGAVLSAGFVVSAVAQDNFPDVPDNHWAYEALARLKKDGLLVGYPDGLFRGNRPASRYELAVAIHATYTHLKNITDGLQSQIDELKSHQAPDLTDIRNAIQQLQNDVNNMKGWGDDIANLKRLADQFQKELASLGVDVEGLKKDLADLAKRVGVLEAHRLPIDIHGDVDMFATAGSSSSHRPGIDVSGRPVGVDGVIATGANGQGLAYPVVGMPKDFHVYHEIGLRLTSNNETGPKWHATLVDTNMLGDYPSGFGVANTQGFGQGHPFSSMSTTDVGSPYQEGADAFYFQDLAVDFDTSLLGQGFSAELGRTSYSVDPYIFQRPDVTPYYQNERWDNGKWIFDGGIAGFHFGGAHLDVFAGRDHVADTAGTEVNPMFAGQVLGHRFTPGVSQRPIGLPNNYVNIETGSTVYAGGLQVDEHLGLNLNVPLTTNGKLDLAYIWLQSNGGIANNGQNLTASEFALGQLNGSGLKRAADNVQVFGGDLKWNFGSIVFDGGFSQSNVFNGNHQVVKKDNYAWHGQLGYDSSKWGAQVGYRQILPQFAAPGDWGRIGLWWNPTDIEGFTANAHVNLASNVKLSAGGEWYEGTQRNFYTDPSINGGGYTTGLNHNDKINRYTAELGFRLNDAWNATLGAEWVDWDIKDRTGFSGGKPRERWYNIGLGYNLSDMARLNFLYQFSDYDGKNVVGFSPFYGYNGTRATGSLLTTQLTVKF
jgi:hypothetical protein